MGTVHSTCACGKPFPTIVPMVKLDIGQQQKKIHWRLLQVAMQPFGLSRSLSKNTGTLGAKFFLKINK